MHRGAQNSQVFNTLRTQFRYQQSLSSSILVGLVSVVTTLNFGIYYRLWLGLGWGRLWQCHQKTAWMYLLATVWHLVHCLPAVVGLLLADLLQTRATNHYDWVTHVPLYWHPTVEEGGGGGLDSRPQWKTKSTYAACTLHGALLHWCKSALVLSVDM